MKLKFVPSAVLCAGLITAFAQLGAAPAFGASTIATPVQTKQVAFVYNGSFSESSSSSSESSSSSSGVGAAVGAAAVAVGKWVANQVGGALVGAAVGWALAELGRPAPKPKVAATSALQLDQ